MNREIKKRGGGVFLGNGTRGIKEFRHVRDGAGGDDHGSAFRVVFREKTELAQRLGSGLFGNGAQFVYKCFYCCCSFFHATLICFSGLLQIWIVLRVRDICMYVCMLSVCLAYQDRKSVV